jgi:hypothetical protein
MPAELVTPEPDEGETPPAAGAPGPEVTPEGGEPAPQPSDAPVDELTQDGLEAALTKASSGQFGANDAEMFRRHYSKAEARVKAAEEKLAAASRADPAGDLAEKLIRQECGTDAALAADHRRWIAEAPNGVLDYIEALRGRSGKSDAAGDQPEETDEERYTRIAREAAKAEFERQYGPVRVAAEKAQVSTQFTSDLDGAIKGMKIVPEVAAHVRVKLLEDMSAWLSTGVPTFLQFKGLPQGTTMADVVQARVKETQDLIDAVQAGKGAPPPPLPEATPVETAPAKPGDEPRDKSIDEMFDELGKKHEAKRAAHGAS